MASWYFFYSDDSIQIQIQFLVFFYCWAINFQSWTKLVLKKTIKDFTFLFQKHGFVSNFIKSKVESNMDFFKLRTWKRVGFDTYLDHGGLYKWRENSFPLIISEHTSYTWFWTVKKLPAPNLAFQTFWIFIGT